MMGLLRLAPYLLLITGIAGGAHWLIVNERDRTIATLTETNESLTQRVALLRATNITDQETIRSLESTIARQSSDINRLQATNNRLNTERDQYMAIFRRHDLARLALARPGLIENRINSGTRQVIRDLEEATQHREEP